MRFTPIILLLTSVAVNALPPPYCPSLDKNPRLPSTLRYHCETILQFDDEIPVVQNMVERRVKNYKKHAENKNLLEEYRTRHTEARDNSAKTIAANAIPFSRPPADSTPQDQVKHHSQQILSHRFEIPFEKIDLEQSRIERNAAQNRLKKINADVKIANSTARVGVREDHIASHTKSILELKKAHPHLNVPATHLTAHGDQPHPSPPPRRPGSPSQPQPDVHPSSPQSRPPDVSYRPGTQSAQGSHPNNPSQSTSSSLPRHPGQSQFGGHPPPQPYPPFHQSDLSYRPARSGSPSQPSSHQAGSSRPPRPPSQSAPSHAEGSSSSQGGRRSHLSMAELLTESRSPPSQGGGQDRGLDAAESSRSYQSSSSRQGSRGALGINDLLNASSQPGTPHSQGGGREPKRGYSMAELLDNKPEKGGKRQRTMR